MLYISVLNQSTAVADTAVESMVLALEIQWNRDLRPVWGIDRAAFVHVPKRRTPRRGPWWLVFLDDSNQAHDLAYHHLTDEGLPISKVFVRTVLADKSSLSVGASHEICEMAVDPWINSSYQDARGVFWAGEICDPVEDDSYGYRIGRTLVSDFVTPDWFAPAHATRSVDFKRRCAKPFAVLAGGYAQKFNASRGWVQVNGESAKASKRAVAPPGSRRERRTRTDRSRWVVSQPKWARPSRR